MFVLQTANPTGRTRSSTSKNMLLHNYDSLHKTFEKSIKFRAIKEWNLLPLEVTDKESSNSQFRDRLGLYIVNSRVNNITNVYHPP